jgi:RNA polymerase sigma factor (sigma-70 family)
MASMDRLEPLFDRFREAGDAGALAEVFDALAPDLLRLARHLVRDRGEAEDLVQATFLAAIERRASFDASRALKPWLAGILVREAARVRRARSRELDPRRLDSRDVAAPEEALAARELSDALALAL